MGGGAVPTTVARAGDPPPRGSDLGGGVRRGDAVYTIPSGLSEGPGMPTATGGTTSPSGYGFTDGVRTDG